MFFFSSAAVVLCIVTPDAPPNRGAVATAIVVRVVVDTPVCKVGDRLTFSELSPEPTRRVRSVRHTVVRVGGYNSKDNRIRAFAVSAFADVEVSDYFEELPESLGTSHGLHCGEVRGGRGLAFDAVPQVPGVYLISCEWRLDGRGVFACAPAVVTVLPAADAAGRPIIKPGWPEDE